MDFLPENASLEQNLSTLLFAKNFPKEILSGFAKPPAEISNIKEFIGANKELKTLLLESLDDKESVSTNENPDQSLCLEPDLKPTSDNVIQMDGVVIYSFHGRTKNKTGGRKDSNKDLLDSLCKQSFDEIDTSAQVFSYNSLKK